MSYIYRSLENNFSIETPVIGLPEDILYIDIEDFGPQYNGAYLFLPKDSPKYLQIKNEVYPGLAENALSIWINSYAENIFISSFRSYQIYWDIIDLLYRSLRSNPNYLLLYNPYFAVQDPTSYDASSIPWDKNTLVYPASSGPYAGLNKVPGGYPQSKKYSINVPERTLVEGAIILNTNKV